jgi:hypothetical protein
MTHKRFSLATQTAGTVVLAVITHQNFGSVISELQAAKTRTLANRLMFREEPPIESPSSGLYSLLQAPT